MRLLHTHLLWAGLCGIHGSERLSKPRLCLANSILLCKHIRARYLDGSLCRIG